MDEGSSSCYGCCLDSEGVFLKGVIDGYFQDEEHKSPLPPSRNGLHTSNGCFNRQDGG